LVNRSNALRPGKRIYISRGTSLTRTHGFGPDNRAAWPSGGLGFFNEISGSQSSAADQPENCYGDS
jgi:hypothetical protein